jgi:DNA repair exonuclease SbcCD ATPase subunit
VEYIGDERVRVTRMNSPKRLSFIRGTKEWNGEEAQAMVNNYFGTEWLWNITSYSAQQTLHPFISHGSTETTFGFFSLIDADNPKEQINAIDMALTEHKNLSELYRKSLDGRSCDHDLCPITEWQDTRPLLLDLKETNQQNDVLSRSVEELQTALELAKKRDNLAQELDQLPLTSSVNILTQELTLAVKAAATTRRREEIVLQLTDVPPYNATEIESMLSSVRRRRIEVEKCDSLLYERQTVDNKIRELSSLIEEHKRNNNVLTEKNKLMSILSTMKPPVKIDKEPLESRLSSINTSLSLKGGDPCPKCGAILTIQKGSFVLGACTRAEEIALKKELSQIKTELDAIKQQEQEAVLYEEYRRRLEELPEIAPVSLPVDCEALLYKLRSVQWIDEVSITEEELLNYKRQLSLRAELTTLPQCQRREEEVKKDLIVAKTRQQLSDTLQSIKEKRKVDILTEQLRKYKEELENVRIKQKNIMSIVENKEINNAIHREHEDCNSIRELTKSYALSSSRIALLSTALSEARLEYDDRVKDTVISINRNLDYMCATLFSNDTLLQLTSTITGAKSKNVIEVMVYRKGEEIDISSLSGGEKVRASLALLLACFSYRKPLFIILDEPIRDVPDSWEDIMLDLIKETTQGTLTVAMSHRQMGSVIDYIVSV